MSAPAGRNIPYAEGQAPAPALAIGALWVPLAAVVLLLLPAEGLRQVGARGLLIAVGGGYLLVLALAYGWLAYAQRTTSPDRQWPGLVLAIADQTSIEGWGLLLVVAALVLLALSSLFGAASPGIAVLGVVMLLAVVLGSRRYERFPKPDHGRSGRYDPGVALALLVEQPPEGLEWQEYRWYFNPQPHIPGGGSDEQQFALAYDPARVAEVESHAEDDAATPLVERALSTLAEDRHVQELAAAAEALRRLNAERGYTPFQQQCNVLAFAADRDAGAEAEATLSRPTATLIRGGGRDSQVVLAATLLHLMGFSTALLTVDAGGSSRLAVGLEGAEDLPDDVARARDPGGRTYLVAVPAENSTFGWTFGAAPDGDVLAVR